LNTCNEGSSTVPPARPKPIIVIIARGIAGEVITTTNVVTAVSALQTNLPRNTRTVDTIAWVPKLGAQALSWGFAGPVGLA
jgi:hypothetical protein